MKDNIDKLRTKFDKGESVIVDKDVKGGSIAQVVSQTPKRLYTTLKDSNGYQWDIMTFRLTKLN